MPLYDIRRPIIRIYETFDYTITKPKKTQKLDQTGTLKGGPFWNFQYFCRKTSKKLKGDPLRTLKNFRKSHNAEKTEMGTLWSRLVLYVTRKKGESFWFSSLGQIVQFDTIKFGRTFKNYFGQFVWIEKKQSL